MTDRSHYNLTVCRNLLVHCTVYINFYITTEVYINLCRTDFIITTSVDGHLKFWKKNEDQGIEFIKHFRCHLGE